MASSTATGDFDLFGIYNTTTIPTTTTVPIPTSSIPAVTIVSPNYLMLTGSTGLYSIGTAINNVAINGIFSPSTTYSTNYIFGTDPYENELKNLTYGIMVDERYYAELADNIKAIKNNKMIFCCNIINNRIVPYELIMRLIADKEKFAMKISVTNPVDGYPLFNINYTNFRFTKIVNNLKFSNKCDFTELIVKFKYDKVTCENRRLTLKQKRTDKLNKIFKDESTDFS